MIRIGLLLPMDLDYGRAVLRGVKHYTKPNKPWRFHLGIPDVNEAIALHDWKPDGVIAHIGATNMVPPLKGLGVPVVNVTNAFDPAPSPRVGIDNLAVGKLAAMHFLERGLTHFAFLGYRGYPYIRDREAGFIQAIREAGYECISRSDPSVVHPTGGGYWGIAEEGLADWLVSLPKPIGILAARDQYGLQLTELCHMHNIHVPEDVAIVGVDNDEVVCEVATPQLSSIAAPGERTGYHAAAMVEDLIKGKTLKEEVLLLPPTGLITRQSSDIMKVEDREVLAAVRFIRNRINEPLNVTDVLNELYISRSSLERKFRSILGRTPLEEIRRVRIEQVKSLLAGSDITVREIARRTGFRSAERLCTTFRASAGEAPSQYRKRFRYHG
jgi:LacI family transcriptional regulator